MPVFERQPTEDYKRSTIIQENSMAKPYQKICLTNKLLCNRRGIEKIFNFPLKVSSCSEHKLDVWKSYCFCEKMFHPGIPLTKRHAISTQSLISGYQYYPRETYQRKWLANHQIGVSGSLICIVILVNIKLKLLEHWGL